MKKLFRDRTIRFITIGVFVYLTLSIGFWLRSNYSSYRPIQKNLEQYASLHEQTLKDEVFTNIFNEAQTCNSLTENEQRSCHKTVSEKLRSVISKEQVENNRDLFFVKQEGNKYFALGTWEGKLKDISSQTDVAALTDNIPYSIDFLMHRCGYFKMYGAQTQYSCDIFATIPLSPTEKGYMVRLAGDDEGNNFLFSFTFPPFLIFLIIPYVFYFLKIPMFLIPLFIVFIAIIIFIYIIKKVNFKRKTKTSSSRKKKT